jgi:guanylate cyclase
MLLGILLFFVTKNLGVFVSVSSFFMLLVPVLLQFQLGGFAASGAVMIWSILAPLTVLVFRGVRQARFWFGGFFVTVLAACIAEQYLPPVINRPAWEISLFFVMNIGAVGTIVFGTIQYFCRSGWQRQETIRKQNETLCSSSRKTASPSPKPPSASPRSSTI